MVNRPISPSGPPARPARRPQRSTSAAPSAPASPPSHRLRSTRRSRRRRFRLRARRSTPANRLASPAIRSAGPVRDSCSASTTAPAATSSPTRVTNSAVDTGPVTEGMCARRDCLAADRATAAQRRRPLSTRVDPSHLATQREACHGTNPSAPASVASSMASSERSDFGSACTTVTGGAGAGTLRRSSTRADSLPLPTSSMTQCASVPSPSLRSSRSPGRIRRTLAAWKPSSPSSTAISPTEGNAST